MGKKKDRNSFTIRISDKYVDLIKKYSEESGLTEKDLIKIFIKFGLKTVLNDRTLDSLISEIFYE